MFRLTKEAGLPEPEYDLEKGFKVTIRRSGFVTGQVTRQVTEEIKRFLIVFQENMKSVDIQKRFTIKTSRVFQSKLSEAIDRSVI
jgi:hypothetical protein